MKGEAERKQLDRTLFSFDHDDNEDNLDDLNEGDMNFGHRISLRGAGNVKNEVDDVDMELGCKEGGKRKSRNLSEKKRRDQFNMLINELCSMVSKDSRKLDKTTVLKSTITFLRNHKEFTEEQHAHEIDENWKPSFLSNTEFIQLMLEALDSFLLVITQNGNILYTSDSVTSFLDMLPNELVNRSLYDLIHPDERMQIYNLMTNHTMAQPSAVPTYAEKENQLTLSCHIRCGEPQDNKPTYYKRVQCMGNFRPWNSEMANDITSLLDNNRSNSSMDPPVNEMCFCCIVRLDTMVRELPIIDESNKEFTSRHSMEWKFLFLDHRGPAIIGWLPFEVLGTSAYDYNHPDDLEVLAASHNQLMQKGKCSSCYYRFMTKGQQWIWLRTKFYITYHPWNSKPEFIVCSNTVVNYSEVKTERRLEERRAKEENEKSSMMAMSPIALSPQCLPDTVMPGIETESLDNQSVSPLPMPSSDLSRTSTGATISLESPALEATQQNPIDSPKNTKPSEMSGVLSQSTDPLSPADPCQAAIGTAAAESDAARNIMNMLPPQPQVSPVQVPVPVKPMDTAVLPAGLITTAPAVFMTPAQQSLQEQLWRKHQALQDAIIRQQEELQKISEQLLMSQLSAPCHVARQESSEHPALVAPQMDHLPGVVAHTSQVAPQTLQRPVPRTSQIVVPQSTTSRLVQPMAFHLATIPEVGSTNQEPGMPTTSSQ